jgi:hypothetical protein
MDQGKSDNSDRSDGERDLTAEMLEWAKDRIGSASKTMPSGVEPLDPAKEPSKPRQEATKHKQQSKMVVVALHEGTADWGQAHFFADSQEASRFIETLMASGLEQDRIKVFQGTPVDVSVSYRPIVAIGQPEKEQAVAG